MESAIVVGKASQSSMYAVLWFVQVVAQCMCVYAIATGSVQRVHTNIYIHVYAGFAGLRLDCIGQAPRAR